MILPINASAAADEALTVSSSTNHEKQSGAPLYSFFRVDLVNHPGGNPGANLKSISHRRYFFEAAFAWELTE